VFSEFKKALVLLSPSVDRRGRFVRQSSAFFCGLRSLLLPFFVIVKGRASKSTKYSIQKQSSKQPRKPKTLGCSPPS